MWEIRSMPVWEHEFLNEMTQRREYLAKEYQKAQRRPHVAGARARERGGAIHRFLHS